MKKARKKKDPPRTLCHLHNCDECHENYQLQFLIEEEWMARGLIM